MTDHRPTHAVAPDPRPNTEPFWAGCEERRLLLRRCEACADVFYFPRLACPRCSGRELSWVQASGRGIVFAHTTVHTSFYGPDWETDIPYTVLLIDLEEGPRMLSRLVGIDEHLRTGAAVEVEFVVVGGRRYPFFSITSGGPP